MSLPVSLPPYLGDFLAGSTVYIPWATFGASAESITLSGLLVSDIEVYKNGSMTQRASDSGYALLDTDGIDLDGATGIHGVSIDTSDDTDAGFFAIGSDYFVVINAVTVNAQTVRFVAAQFSIENRAGKNGVGDYAVTLTIRTTGSAPISGISVWVNSTNDRSGSVAGTKVTDSNGQVTFNLEYTTYYIFCHLANYTFANASFTAAAGSVAFTKDIATAVSSGSASFYEDSFLSRAIVDVRECIDEPETNAKYTDARLIELIEKAYILVYNEKMRNTTTPAVARQEITLVADTLRYDLPHVLSSVYGIYHLADLGTKVFYDGRGKQNHLGQGMWIEGNVLRIQSTDQYEQGLVLTVEWIPSGIARLHNGTCTISADGLTITMNGTPNAGAIDTHNQAYAGSSFRILGVDGTTVVGNFLQERNIAASSNTALTLTLETALDPIPTTDDGTIYYEIAPAINKGMESAVALYVGKKIAHNEGNAKRAKGILTSYRDEIRNLRLNAYYTNMPEAPRMKSDGHDNRRYRRP
jgi:hypothetical protein